MKIENQALGISMELPELKQRDVEAYFRAARDLLGGEVDVSSPEYQGVTVRAAARAGMLPGIKEDDVGDMSPAATHLLARAVNNHIAESLSVPVE